MKNLNPFAGFKNTRLALVLLLIIPVLSLFTSCADKTFAYEGEYPESVVVELFDDDDNLYTIEAIRGQACVWFEEGVPYSTAKDMIQDYEGKIVAQIPDRGYYLVELPDDDVQFFVDMITIESGVERAFPNMVFHACMTHNFVLDNFYTRKKWYSNEILIHGIMVSKALLEYAKDTPIKPYNIGTRDGSFICGGKDNMCANNEVFALDDISRLGLNGPIIINMSYGPALPNDKNTWNDASSKEKGDYRLRYLEHIRGIIHNLKPLEDMDYIAILSAGNEGVKTFDADIINVLRTYLSPYEQDIMDKHFLLVTAGETAIEHQDYSNEMEKWHYDPWVTKVNISDFIYNGKKRRGTSFAAPRAAGILSKVANEKNLTGLEVLQYARMATLSSPNNELTLNGILEQISPNNPPKDTQRIIKIPPFKASKEMLLYDLPGDVIDGYKLSWRIYKEDITDIKIVSETKIDDENYVINVIIRLEYDYCVVDVDMDMLYSYYEDSWIYYDFTVNGNTFPNNDEPRLKLIRI